MIKKIYISIFFLLSFSQLSQAQFINFQITIEPELSTTIEQDLNFGDIVSNTGLNTIQLGDYNMGIFSIQALNTQSIFVQMIAPPYLTEVNNRSNDIVPLDLNLAYSVNENNYRNSRSLANNQGYLHFNENHSDENLDWTSIYFFVYGSLDIGNIDNGTYSTDIILEFQYD